MEKPPPYTNPRVLHTDSPVSSVAAAFWLPLELVCTRLLTWPSQQRPFVRKSTVFEHVVFYCVKYAFVHVPHRIGRVFFSRFVAVSFLRWRQLRTFVPMAFGLKPAGGVPRIHWGHWGEVHDVGDLGHLTWWHAELASG